MSRNVIEIVNIERKEKKQQQPPIETIFQKGKGKERTIETRIEKLAVHVTDECF